MKQVSRCIIRTAILPVSAASAPAPALPLLLISLQSHCHNISSTGNQDGQLRH
jgi:hypothetical protein